VILEAQTGENDRHCWGSKPELGPRIPQTRRKRFEKHYRAGARTGNNFLRRGGRRGSLSLFIAFETDDQGWRQWLRSNLSSNEVRRSDRPCTLVLMRRIVPGVFGGGNRQPDFARRVGVSMLHADIQGWSCYATTWMPEAHRSRQGEEAYMPSCR